MNMITKLSLQIPCPTTTTFFSTPHGRRNTPLLIPCHLRFHCKPNSFMIKTNYMQTGRLDRVIHHPIILCRASPPEKNNGNGKNSGEVVLFKPGKIMVIRVAVLSLCVIGVIMSSYQKTTAMAKPWWGTNETITTTTTTTTTTTSNPSAQEAKHIGSIKEDLDNLISRGKEDLEKHTPSLTMKEDGDVRSLVGKWTLISGPHEKYEYGLSLIEILIKKEQYDEAEEICSYLQERELEMQQMDERIALRRFIIMLERARKHLKEYEDIMKTRGGSEGPEDSLELD